MRDSRHAPFIFNHGQGVEPVYSIMSQAREDLQAQKQNDVVALGNMMVPSDKIFRELHSVSLQYMVNSSCGERTAPPARVVPISLVRIRSRSTACYGVAGA